MTYVVVGAAGDDGLAALGLAEGVRTTCEKKALAAVAQTTTV